MPGGRADSPPTMADIAAHLGVSRQLVSLVFRDAPGASEETRRRVRRAADELGFSPHVGARSLRRTRSTDLGVVFAPAHSTEFEIIEHLGQLLALATEVQDELLAALDAADREHLRALLGKVLASHPAQPA